MDRHIALIWSWLNVLNAKRYEALKSTFGDLTTALSHLDEALLKELGCKEETIFTSLNRLNEFDVEAYEAELEKRGIEFCSVEDDCYPAALSVLPDFPVFLYSKGSREIVTSPCIGCVGTRAMSEYGQRLVEEFIPAFVQSDIVTVSGAALGVDEMVARETMNAGGKTVACLGFGFSEISPRSTKNLVNDIVASGGLIVSEYPLDTTADKFTFPARNRIIAGLSLGTVVFEAPAKSGALITADLALGYGKDVFAVPGDVFNPNYEGCHRILTEGSAKLVSCPEDVMQEIGIVLRTQSVESLTFTDDQQQQIYDVLTTMPQSVTDLVEKSDIDAAVLNAKLTMLELSGAVKNVGGGMWVRK